jgi:4-amino-4-deoxychorismate lyase
MTNYWYDGELIRSSTIQLNIDDPGLLYGATVFTTLRVYHNCLDSSLTNWDAHCDRLKFSLQAFGWETPNWQRLRQGAELIKESFPILRITLFPDGREWITGRLLPEILTINQKYGLEALVSTPEYNRSLPTHKTGNYLTPWLSRNIALNNNAQEAILVDASGNWLETSTGNLWGWRDGNWWTPAVTAGILPGVVRNQLIAWLASHNQPVKEEPWTQEIVKSFEALAYSNSVVEVIPIHTAVTAAKKLKYNPHHPSLQLLREMFVSH